MARRTGIRDGNRTADERARGISALERARRRPPAKVPDQKAPAPVRAAQRPRPADATAPVLVVGIIASAGGIEAFGKFLDALPTGTGMSFVLVPHLDPHRQSLMVELLVRHTVLPVREAADGDRLQAEHVYVIAPNTVLMLRDGKIRLNSPLERDGSAGVMDTFLSSLAEDQREKAVGIVLSGTGWHGSVGAKAIKTHGGIVIAQDPASATQASMPRATIAAGVADLVLSPEAMPQALIDYTRLARVDGAGRSRPISATSDQIDKVLALLRSRTRFDFRSYRKSMLLRRIQRRMGLNNVENLNGYVGVLSENEGEVKRLARDLHVSVTAFFRDPEAYRLIETVVIPDLLRQRTADNPIRIWVPACATGEEAYSLAMLFMDKIGAEKKSANLQVFGTDVDAEALDVAREGVYPASVLNQVGAERRARFFVKVDDNRCQVDKALRERVLFAQQNILGDAPFSRVDLISCRNLLIYLEPEVQQRVVSLLHFGLNPGGYLLLGPSETIGPHTDLFEPVSKKWRLFRRKEARRRSRVEIPIEAGAEKGEWRPAPVTAAPAPAALGPAIEQALLEAYAPASIVIDTSNYEAVFFHGPTDRYLQMPSGKPTHELTALVREGLRERLRAAVHKAMREGHPATIGGARIKRNRRYVGVRITARPLHELQAADKFLLVSFEDEASPASTVVAGAKGKRDETMVARQLEHELKDTRAALQATIEELERANEELKTSNEEVMSMNEELQSTNEELETSKEELQSLNEELSTVNSQLQEKLVQLEAANNDLSNLMASADTPTVFLAPDRLIKRFSAAATRLFRLIDSDTGRPIRDIKWRFEDSTFEADADEVLHTLVPREREVHSEDGHWYLRRITPYRTADDHIEGVVATFAEITHAKQAQDALRDNNAELEQRVGARTAELTSERNFMSAVLDTAAALIIVFDRSGRIVRWNAACAAASGKDEREVKGRRLWDLGLIAPEDVGSVRAAFDQLREGRKTPLRRESRWLRPDGGRRHIAWSNTCLRNAAGEVEYILGTGIDVTEQRQAEGEARAHQVALLHAHRTMAAGELAGALAHEVNQPLSVIANLCEATLQQLSGLGDGSAVVQNLSTISQQVQRAGRVLHELRAFIARRDVDKTDVDVNGLVSTAHDLVAPEAANRKVRIELDLAAEALTANVAAIHIEHTLVNLLQNAIEAIGGAHGADGLVRVSTRRNSGSIDITVADNGPGFSPDVIERAFEPFFTTKPDGLGLGLAIARSVIEANDGRLIVDRNEPSGATLRISLPATP